MDISRKRGLIIATQLDDTTKIAVNFRYDAGTALCDDYARRFLRGLLNTRINDADVIPAKVRGKVGDMAHFW